MSDSKKRHLAYKKNILEPISGSVCAAKWYNATIWLGMGGTTSCHHPPFHQIDTEEIKNNPKAIHNTKEKKLQRKQMLEGQRPSGCEYCWTLEDLGDEVISDRVYKSIIYDDQEVKSLPEVGHDTDVDLKTLEISFDRNCNFACAYCNSSFSSRWAKEMRQLGPFTNLIHGDTKAFNHNADNDFKWEDEEKNPFLRAFWQWWPELSNSLQELRVTGGEPLLSQQFWKLLEKIEKEKPSFSFATNSNLGVPNALIDKLIKASNQIENFDLYTSCETTKEHAEYIRDGLEYDRFVSNIEKLISKSGFRSINIMMTINALCLFEMTSLFDQIYEWKRKSKITVTFTLNILRFPAFMSVLTLPEDLRIKYSKKLYRWVDEYKDDPLTIKHEVESVERLASYLVKAEKAHSKSTDRRILEIDFKNFFLQYDKRRNKSILDTFPQEFGEWFNSINEKVPKKYFYVFSDEVEKD
ncbi:twitch domain-containing radical SAM protein [Halobacteriovorax sp. HLS]|uniref:twitch domain-containing radical SAM protein n=1 Tax=Halobacteriovorax sp. HLS TaxID=2234000 RepID=UPI000FDACB6A|nr:twitch domain-containing radical SAM protein [Halobacteriovorax sp. HLS]